MALRTPLYEWHASAGARFIEFGGWEMPLQYTGIVEEHIAVRRSAGLFDVSHMGKLLVEGAAARSFLEGLSANTLSGNPGRARYTHLLRDNGTVLDDVIVTCLSTHAYFVVCNAGPRPDVLAWLESHRTADVRIQDLTRSHLCLALQGPRAPELLQRLTSIDLAALKPFDGTVIDLRPPEAHRAGPVEIEGWGSVPRDSLMAAAEPIAQTSSSGGPRVLLTRTGYTGEPGFELFPSETLGRWVWESVLSAEADLAIRPIGLGARDTLRLEEGYLLSGQDFDGRQTPLEVGCAWVVKFDHTFLGREALESQRAQDVYPRLVGLRMQDKGIPRHSCRVLADGRGIGAVTSGTMSPSLRVGIALASVDKAHAQEGTAVQVEIRGLSHPAVVVRPPFVRSLPLARARDEK